MLTHILKKIKSTIANDIQELRILETNFSQLSFAAIRILLKVFIALLVFTTIFNKGYFLLKTGPNINAEVIGENNLTNAGKRQISKIFTPNFSLETFLEESEPCRQSISNIDCAMISNSFKFKKLLQKKSEWDAEYLNFFPITLESSFRGRYIHHYSTILFPYREMSSGNFASAITAQNGFVSIIPLLIIGGSNFNIYAALGTFFLLLLFSVVMIKTFKSDDFFIISLILLVVGMTLNQDALKIHPGFSYIRYFPSVTLIYLVSKKDHSRYNSLGLSLLIFIALVNSIQFNILAFTAITFTLIANFILSKKMSPQTLRYFAAISCIIFLQVYLYNYQKNFFTPQLFGSVGEGLKNIKFTWYILMYPTVSILIKAFCEGRNFNFKEEELLGYNSYILFSSYALTQFGSPQHYSGFLFMSSYSAFLIIKNIRMSSLYRWLPLILLLTYPAKSFNYVTRPKPDNNPSSEILDYRTYGNVLVFKTPTNIEKIYLELQSLKNKHSITNNYYLLSKDKIYLELYINKNISPKGYDSYLSSSLLTSNELSLNLKKAGIDYLITDSPFIRKVAKQIIAFASYSLKDSRESDYYLKLLKTYEDFSAKNSEKLLECSKRFCIYKI